MSLLKVISKCQIRYEKTSKSKSRLMKMIFNKTNLNDVFLIELEKKEMIEDFLLDHGIQKFLKKMDSIQRLFNVIFHKVQKKEL